MLSSTIGKLFVSVSERVFFFNDIRKKYWLSFKRWGEDCRAKNGGYWTHADRFDPGEIQEHKFENAMTIDRTWGYRKNILMKDIKTPDYMIQQIVRTSK